MQAVHVHSHGPGYKSLTNRRNFAGPFVTSVGGTTGVEPELWSRFSGGGFSEFFDLPDFQISAVAPFLENFGTKYKGLYKCVRSSGLWPNNTHSYYVICAALRDAASLTSPCNQ